MRLFVRPVVIALGPCLGSFIRNEQWHEQL